MSKESYRVSKQEGGMKLLAFLRSHCSPSISTKAIKRAIDGKQCHVNGRIETISTKPLQAGDRVEIKLLAHSKNTPSILYEDADLLVINKTPQITCDTPSINALFPAYQGALELIHRLDKETSGVLLIAKNAPFKERMVTLFKEKALKKVYRAIVDGSVAEQQGRCEGRLAKVGGHGNQTVWGSVTRGGLEAITDWKRLAICRTASYLEVEPLTGRTHQIRVHLYEMGHPILGDVQYRYKRFRCPYQPQRNLLHALSIEFIHPITENRVVFKAPLPTDFKVAVEKLFN